MKKNFYAARQKWIVVAMGLIAPLFTLAQAQSPSYHPWNWEIGLRPTNLRTYYESGELFQRFNQGQFPNGMEIYLLQRRPNHTFSRLGIGFGQRVIHYAEPLNLPGDYHLDSPTQEEASLRASCLTAEAAFGWELPVIPKKWLDRFRLRAGLSLAVQCLQNQAYRKFQMNDDAYAYLHRFVSGGSFWRGTAMVQAQFRLIKGAFLGLEWRYGPSLLAGNILRTTDNVRGGINGYSAERRYSRTDGHKLVFSNPIGLPMIFLSYSF